MPIARPRVSRRAATAALAGLALTSLAACGGDEAGSGASPARLAPASSAFYAEAVVRPEGDLREDLDALIGKLAPGRDLDAVVAKAFARGSGDVDYKRDVEPWLGERAGLAITGLGAGGEPDGAAIIDTTDADKALASVRKAADGKVEEREYDGTGYLYDTADKGAAAIVDETLVVGTEAGFKAVVDASGGDGLDASAAFGKVVGAVDEDALGFVYGDVRRATDLAARAAGPGQAEQFEGLREFLDRRGIKTFAASLVANGDAVKLRGAALGTDAGDGAAAAETLAALPAGSWAAAGLGDLGKSLSDALDGLGSLSGSGAGFDLQSGLEQFKEQSGFDLQKDLLGWMGQAGLFVRGTTLTDIGGALVVQSKDPAATRAALGKARTLAAGLGLQARELTGPGIDAGFSVRPQDAPVELFAALAGERFVLAINRAALDEAISPTGRLADDDAFKAAAETLGDGFAPTFFLDFPKVSGLIGLAASGQPGFAEAKRYLDRIGTIAAGSKRDGDLTLQTLTIGVR